MAWLYHLMTLRNWRQAVPLAPAVDQPVEVVGHRVDPLVEGRFGAGVAVLGPVGELAEQERVRERPPADRDRRAAGLAEHGLGVGQGPDVAVADDRDRLDRLDHRADPLAVDLAR